MLLELFRWLEQLQSHFGLFQYLTFRAILSALTALALSLWWGPKVIRYLASLKSGGQPIRTDGIERHVVEKAGTPTMGGVMILAGLLVVSTCIMYFAPSPGGAGFAEGVFGLFFASLVHASELVGIILVWRFLTIYLGMLIGVPVTLHELARRRMGNG